VPEAHANSACSERASSTPPAWPDARDAIGYSRDKGDWMMVATAIDLAVVACADLGQHELAALAASAVTNGPSPRLSALPRRQRADRHRALQGRLRSAASRHRPGAARSRNRRAVQGGRRELACQPTAQRRPLAPPPARPLSTVRHHTHAPSDPKPSACGTSGTRIPARGRRVLGHTASVAPHPDPSHWVAVHISVINPDVPYRVHAPRTAPCDSL
jgi:hypothetical protein